MVELTRDPRKIEQANVMREARKCVKKVSTFGRSEGEVQARLAGLRARAASHRPPPRVDDHGRVFYNQDWVALSPVEHRLFGALLADYGADLRGADIERRHQESLRSVRRGRGR